MYRKMTGMIAWVANSTRPDLCYIALQMSKKNKGATISDLRDVNRILREGKRTWKLIEVWEDGDKEDLIIVGVGDTSFKTDDKMVGGVFLCLANSTLTRAAPIYWKFKQIDCVCHSLKDAEALNLLKMVEDSIFAAQQLEFPLYEDVSGKIPFCLFTNSESILESVASSKEIVAKTLWMIIVDLKKRLLWGEVTSYAWLSMEMRWADILSKDKKLPDSLEDVLLKNMMNLQDVTINEVKVFGQEVRMTNIHNIKALETPNHKWRWSTKYDGSMKV